MKRIKEDMVAGTYNPGKELSFGDLIMQELENRRASGSLSPVLIHSNGMEGLGTLLLMALHRSLFR